jgi:hypothetical protein
MPIIAPRYTGGVRNGGGGHGSSYRLVVGSVKIKNIKKKACPMIFHTSSPTANSKDSAHCSTKLCPCRKGVSNLQ